MDNSGCGTVTWLLSSAQRGDAAAADRLFPLIYSQLRALARRRMTHERAGHTLQPTALVHEAYIRLMGGEAVHWSDRAQFFLAAAQAMRRILIEHARALGTHKRGGGCKRIPLNNLLDLADGQHAGAILSLDEAISRLQEISRRAAQVVQLRFYAGLSTGEVAQAMGISDRSVQREWTFARAWLARELDSSDALP